MAGIGRNRRMAPVRCIGQQRRLILVTEPELELNMWSSQVRATALTCCAIGRDARANSPRRPVFHFLQ